MSSSPLITPLLLRSWRSIIAATTSHLVYALLPMQVPIAAGLIVASLSGEQPTIFGMEWSEKFGTPITFAITMLLGLAIATSCAAFCRSISTATLSRSIVASLRVLTIQAIHKVSRDWPLALGPVELQDRIINDCAQVRRYVERVYVHAIVNVVRIGYPVITLFVIDSNLAAWALLILVPQVLFTLWMMRRLSDAMRNVRQTRSVLNHRVADFVKLRESGELDSTLESISRLEDEEMTSVRYTAVNTANVWFFTCLGVALVWWLGARSVTSGSMGLGELVAFVGTLVFVYQPIRQFAQIANTSRRGIVALERLSELLEVARHSEASRSGESRMALPPSAAVPRDKTLTIVSSDSSEGPLEPTPAQGVRNAI